MKKILESILNLIFKLRTKFPMFSFISFRIFSMIVILFFLGLAVFGLMKLAPGDVVENYAKNQIMNINSFRKNDNIYNEEEIKLAKKMLGLDKPFYEQYFHWLYQIFVKHDLGKSLISKAPILFLIQDRMINSLILNIISLIFLTIFSFGLGIYFSSKVGTKVDIIATFTALFLHSFPWILLLILLQVFAAISGLFPVTAYPDFPFRDNPVKFTFSYIHHIILPLLGAFLAGVGGTMRMLRATMLDQLGQPYITALRARGISERKIYFSHAFRNTLNPYITSSADLLASLFSGSLILEIIFSYPGIGRLMYEAVLQEDINLVLANIMFISALILVGMIIADILLALVDPRIRYGKQ
ncbi:MAG: ABC transporter permease [Spirochaetes bacterium GWD1_27_9]|nr:MAG: ABC transporter permease [Spirochaetes bacterium GWB1_27_13]OHD21841.1 MAG: ABC transporter permease [Spirochaetes bacterium GWC1_27_15]OHD38990.1 MAG: ABC transporter permease [Spirochaetes bacterium GWD1_27_9]